MTRRIQRLALVIAILASFIGYLYHAPNSEGIEQMNRIRLISIPIKLAHLVGNVVEFFGISTRVVVIRKFSSLTILLKNKTIEDANLQIDNALIENIPVRIVRPLNNNNDLPVIVYFHGGAFYMGSIDTHNALTSTIAREANVVVVSVNYRLAPEYPYPAGLDDCYTVTKYILDYKHSKNLHIDPTRAGLAGDSAGGSLAAIIAMRFATESRSQYLPRLQILIYPSLQFFDMMLPSYIEQHFQFLYYTAYHKLSLYLNETIDKSLYSNNHTSIAQKKFYRKYIDWSLIPLKYRTIYKQPTTDNYEGDSDLIKKAKKVLHPDISPLLVEDEKLAKLPLTYILTVGHDKLRDEGFIYAGRLKQVGVHVTHNHYENTFHGSITFLYGRIALDIARQMVNDIVQYIKENL